jgi:uncharacterized protein YndB with AHSA1/START domain
MKKSFSVTVQLPATPEAVFKAWLSSKGHTDMTGGAAKVEPGVGGRFTAWDGYISGKTLELVPNSRIVQAWRTNEFGDSDPDSRIEVVLQAHRGGTKLTLTHSGIPEGQTDSYRSGWEEWYFAPMRDFFAR